MLAATALALSGIACAVLGQQAWREHRGALGRRAEMFSEAEKLFPGGRTLLGPDGFPTFVATRPDGGELVLSLIADTLVTRRLPQLWLKLSLRDGAKARDFSLGALARPTGAEFYALTHEFPDRHDAPSGDTAMILRGENLPADASFEKTIASLFSDMQLKEAAVTPRGVRIVRQVAQGDRGAHLLMRQARFPVETVPRQTILAGLRDAAFLSAALRSEPAILSEAA